MNSTPVRLVLVAVIVAVSFVWIERVRRESVPEKVFLPKGDLRKMPLEFGTWKGEPMELDPELFRAVDAFLVVDRAYHNPTGRVITLHCAAFTDYALSLPHDPTLCYRGSGHQIVQEGATKLYLDADSNVTVHLLSMQRSGTQVQSMYWYQVGDQVVYDGNGIRATYWKWRSKDARPAVVKVLLQTTARDPIEGEEQLRAFAALVYRWLQSIQGPGEIVSGAAAAASPAATAKPPAESLKAPSSEAAQPSAGKSTAPSDGKSTGEAAKKSP